MAYSVGRHIPPAITQDTPEDNTYRYVTAQVMVYVATGLHISTDVARAISAYWQDPFNAFGVFASTGEIYPSFYGDIQRELSLLDPEQCFPEIMMLRALSAYVEGSSDLTYSSITVDQI